jgi:O-antigen/teichoic acid export membrane protein
MSALTKYVSEYNGNDDQGMVNKIINASFSFYVLIGLIIAVLLVICSVYFPVWFKIEASNVVLVRQLFLAASVSALFVWPLSTFRGTIQGLNLYTVDAMVNTGTQLTNALAAFILLSSGHGIVQLFIISQMLTILGSVILFYAAKRNLRFQITFPYVDWGTFKQIFSFSIFMFVGSLLCIFIFQIHNLIIGYFLSVSAITTYAVAYNMQNYFRYINSTLGVSPWTIASELEGRKDYDGQIKLLFVGTKYMSAMLLPVILITLVFTEPFILNWMGSGFGDSIMPARIIMFFWLFNGTNEIASGMLSAKGIVREPLYVLLAVAVLNIFIVILMIKHLGLNAMALGLTIPMIFVAYPLLLGMLLKSLGVQFREYFNRAIRRNLPLYVFVTVVSSLVLWKIYPAKMIWTLAEMALIYFVSLAFYYFILLKQDERQEINKLIGLEKIRRYFNGQ